MKKLFEEPVIEVARFSVEDIMTESTNTLPKDDLVDWT